MIHEHTLDTDTKKSRLGALRRRIVGPPHDIHVARGQVCLLTCARRLLCHSHTERGERSVLAQSLCGETESIDIREEQSWDLASGNIRLTPTGHIHAVTGLYASDRHPYMFSVGCDKLIKCWDLEQNKTIRSCHTHLSGVYDVAILPNIDVIVTCGRDSVARVWDIRTKARKFLYRTCMCACVVYGGAIISDQFRDMDHGVDVVVVTPGRLVDFLERGRVTLTNIRARRAGLLAGLGDTQTRLLIKLKN
eukprot:31212_1